MGKKEEITDIISEEGIRQIKVGQLLKFDDGENIIKIKVTRKDTVNMRIWGEHVTTIDAKIAGTHEGHNVNMKLDPPYCMDCGIHVDQKATKLGVHRYEKRMRKKIRHAKKGIR